MDIESRTSTNTVAPSKSEAPLRGHFKAGHRPAVRVIAAGWDTDATTAFSDLFELVAINSLTAYVRNPGFVGELAFDADEVIVVDPESWLSPLTGTRSVTRPPTESGSESAVWAPRTRHQLIAADLLLKPPPPVSPVKKIAGSEGVAARIPEVPQKALTGLSEWIDAGISFRDPETILLHRVIKLAKENGEAVTKLFGALGANPRKSVTNTLDDVVEELLDAAITALGAVEHITGNTGQALGLLDRKIVHMATRAGVIA